MASGLELKAELSRTRAGMAGGFRHGATMSHEVSLVVLFVASLLAGAQNALAGGGSFVTLPALLLAGLDPRAANVTSTVALFPGQVLSGWAGRKFVRGTSGLSFRALCAVSLVGGAAGAVLLLATPATFFALLVPWLVLFATAVFAWGSFFRRSVAGARRIGPVPAAAIQFVIAVYGGYFGGGIGFLMLAALTAAGLAVRAAGATKNALAGVMNFSALLIFLWSPDVHWGPAFVVCVAAIIGGLIGAWMLQRVPERVLRGGVVVIGAALTVGLFLRPV
jgi:uncharacterized protein